MTELVNILTASRAVTTVIGLCAFLAALFAWLIIRRREMPLTERLLGEGAVRPRDVVRILAQYSSDEHRLKAMRQLLQGDAHKAEQLLGQAKAVEKIGSVSLKHMSMARNGLIVAGIFFLLLGVLGIASGSRDVHDDNDSHKAKSNTDKIAIKENPVDPGPTTSRTETAPAIAATGSPNVDDTKPATVVPAKQQVADAKPVVLPGFEVRAGTTTFKVREGKLQSASDQNSKLTLSVRLINAGSESVMFSDSLFRLVAGDTPIAPETFSDNSWVARDSAKDGDVVFILPRDVRKAVLKVGHPPLQTEHEIDLKGTGK